MDKVVVTFDTISQALKFEKVLKSRNIDVELKPVPRKLSSSCGSCAGLEEEKEDVLKIIDEENLIYDKIFTREEWE